MVDRVTVQQRSENMRRIKGKGMKPELAVRSLLHGWGYRFRLHAADLPGRPDIVFRSRQKVVFVHGCFWHQHRARKCPSMHVPKSRLEYWMPKLARNIHRDRQHLRTLRRAGWSVLVVWECELKNLERLENRLLKFMEH